MICIGKAWLVFRTVARPFLEGVLPFLIEKKKQVEIVLAMTKGEGALVNALLRELKGNYTVGLKDKLDDVSEDSEETFIHLE